MKTQNQTTTRSRTNRPLGIYTLCMTAISLGYILLILIQNVNL